MSDTSLKTPLNDKKSFNTSRTSPKMGLPQLVAGEHLEASTHKKRYLLLHSDEKRNIALGYMSTYLVEVHFYSRRSRCLKTIGPFFVHFFCFFFLLSLLANVRQHNDGRMCCVTRRFATSDTAEKW